MCIGSFGKKLLISTNKNSDKTVKQVQKAILSRERQCRKGQLEGHALLTLVTNLTPSRMVAMGSAIWSS